MTNEKQKPQLDWQQVVLNGGPPCFYVEGPQYCGRAKQWDGHGNEAFHDFVSLDDLLATVRAEEREAAFKDAIAIIVGQPTTHYIYSGAYPMATDTFRDNAVKAIEATIAIERARAENRKGEG